MKVRFYHSDKARERILAEAFLDGVLAHGRDEVEKRALGSGIDFDCDVSVMCGVKSRELWKAHARAGVALIYQDKGYSRHSRDDDIRAWEYWRVAVNAHQPTAKFKPGYPSDRRDALGWTFKPWRKEGRHIVIAGSSAKYHAFYDLRDPTDWASKLVKQIEGLTTRPIVYRPKPSWKEAVEIRGTTFSTGDEGIADVLQDAHVLLTHGSNACFEAMLAGVPTIVLGDAVAKPISSTAIEEIESPRLAEDKDRDELLNFLAYQQWTLAEMAAGEAWKNIRPMIYG